ncbi:MAG: hypothetical protein GTO18_06435 [Anaerolineales bacterium]|nr:hypothetical protein [Anaerolineales bacterium]
MNARELQAYLKSLDGGWVHPENTVDTIKSGNSEVEITGIAVAWMSYLWALEKAVELDCNVFITHEPTYYSHQGNDMEIFNLRSAFNKRAFLEETGLTVIRCHDLWDQFPDIGIPDSWGQLLGFGEAIDGNGFLRVYDVRGRTALDVAQQVASRTKEYGQEAVQLIGPADYPVTRLGIGTGAITPYRSFLHDYQVDLAICTDDGMFYCFEAAIAIDMGLPMIVVNHPVSEEVGMINLAHHLENQFPSIPVHHIPQGCMYRLISVP